MKVEKLAKNGEKGQNCYPLSPGTELKTAADPATCIMLALEIQELQPATDHLLARTRRPFIHPVDFLRRPIGFEDLVGTFVRPLGRHLRERTRSLSRRLYQKHFA